MLRSGAYDVLSRLECMLRNGGRGVWRLTALLYQCDSGLHCTLLLLQCQWAVFAGEAARGGSGSSGSAALPPRLACRI